MHETHYLKCLTSVLNSEVEDVVQLFLRIIDCWNFLDIGLLELLIEIFATTTTTKRMEKYNTNLKRFRLNPIGSFVKAMLEKDLHPNQPPQNSDFTIMIQDIDWDPYEHTLQDLDTIRKKHHQKLRALSLSQTALMVYDHATLNCVVVSWLIMADDVKYFEQMFEHCIANGTFFEENDITRVQLDGHIFMTMEMVKLSSAC